MSGNNHEMRDYMLLVESYATVGVAAPDPEMMDAPPLALDPPMLDDLRDLVFKLRAHSENDEATQALGFEGGMERAADMLDNLIRRHGG